MPPGGIFNGVAVLSAAVSVEAAVPAVVSGISGVPLGFQQQALSGAAQSLPSIPAGATLAVIVPTVTITWRDDGVAPTVAIGMVWPANTPIYYCGNLAAFQYIGSTGNVNVSYYK